MFSCYKLGILTSVLKEFFVVSFVLVPQTFISSRHNKQKSCRFQVVTWRRGKYMQ